METFLQALTASLQDAIIKELGVKLNQFADNLVAESKGAITKDQVVAAWAKISPDVSIVAGKAPSPAKTGAPRLKTDKEHKCQVLKKSGASAGQPCGGNCVVGANVCSRHLTTADREKLTGVSAGAVPVVAPPAGVAPAPVAPVAPVDPAEIPTDDALKAMTVLKLKELAKALKINVPSKARKDDIIGLLVKARAGPTEVKPAEEKKEEPKPEEKKA